MTTEQPHFDQPKPFGTTAEGQSTNLYCLSLDGCLSVFITNYGGTVTQVWAPDRNGNFADVVLGFNEVSQYENDSNYLGAIVGRVANRIAKGRFILKGKTYEVAENHISGGQSCHIHGGNRGFDKAVWTVESYRNDDTPLLKLSYRSTDGEEGYPGNLQIIVTYTLTPEGTLAIEYEATTDATTIVNLTNHSYFNLKGEGADTILDHQLTIKSDSYTPVTKTLIPTGEIRSVDNTPFDFRKPKAIGQDIEHDDEQIHFASGFDHNYVLKGSLNWLRRAASVSEPDSGRVLDVYTTKPGMQFYSGNSLEANNGKSGKAYLKHGAFCLETQGFPDAPNHRDFPSIELLPEEIYRSQTLYRFTTDRTDA